MNSYIKKFVPCTILFAVIGVVIITAFNVSGFLKWFIIFTIIVSSIIATHANINVIKLVCFIIALDTFICITFCSKDSYLAALGLVICLIVMLLSDFIKR